MMELNLNEIEGLNLSSGGSLRVCKMCRLPFVAFMRPNVPEPNMCPKCVDLRQERPSIVEERRCLHEFDGVEIESLPGEWQEFHTGHATDFACYKIDVKGEQFGAQWHGRIVIYAGRPWEVGDVVKVRVMEAVHRVKRVREERTRSDFETNQSVTYIAELTVPIQSEGGEEVLERRPYVALEPTTAESMLHLVWCSAYTKTTIKGYGRQIHNHLSGLPIWEQRIRGGYRSGRAFTEAALAIVDDAHPLEVVEGKGDEGFSAAALRLIQARGSM